MTFLVVVFVWPQRAWAWRRGAKLRNYERLWRHSNRGAQELETGELRPRRRNALSRQVRGV